MIKRPERRIFCAANRIADTSRQIVRQMFQKADMDWHIIMVHYIRLIRMICA